MRISTRLTHMLKSAFSCLYSTLVQVSLFQINLITGNQKAILVGLKPYQPLLVLLS